MNFGGGGASALSARLFGGGASCERIQEDCYTLVSHRGNIMLPPRDAKHLLEGLQAAVDRGNGLKTAQRCRFYRQTFSALFPLGAALTFYVNPWIGESAITPLMAPTFVPKRVELSIFGGNMGVAKRG